MEDVSLADVPSEILCTTEITLPGNANTVVPTALKLPPSLPKNSELVVTARLYLHTDDDLRIGDFVTVVSYPLPERGSNLDLYLKRI